MKRQIMSLLLAGVMLGGISLTVAACSQDNPPDPVEHEHVFSKKWSSDETTHWHAATCEHTDLKKDEGAHDYGKDNICDVCAYVRKDDGKEEPDDETYEPGDIVKSEKVYAALNNALRAEYAGMGTTFNAEGEVLPIGEVGVPFSGTVQGEGVFAMTGNTAVDIGATVENEERESYMLAFLREGEAWFDHAPLTAAEVDYAALLEAYRKADGPALQHGSLENEEAPWLEAITTGLPVLGKLSKNMLVYAKGEIVKTQSGYMMTADGVETLDKMIGDVQTALETLKGPTMMGRDHPGLATVEEFLKQPTLYSMLETMLYGITADGLIALLGFVPDLDLSMLPKETTPDMGALDYLWICLRSPELAGKLLDLYVENRGISFPETTRELFTKGGMAGAPMSTVWSVLFQEDFDRDLVVEQIAAFRVDLRENVLIWLLGEGAKGDVELTVKAYFGEDRALTSLDVDMAFKNVEGAVAFEITTEESESRRINADIRMDGALHVSFVPHAERPSFADLANVNTVDFTPSN